MNKRDFLKVSVAAAAASLVPPARATSPVEADQLQDMTRNAAPISVAERKDRVARAQRLMQDAGIGALVIEPGAALVYFTGIRWWRSERFTGAVIPAEGEIGVVTPFFEEPSVRESMSFGDDVRTWNEHENPFALVHGILRDRGLQAGKIAVEETVRHFVVDGLQQAAPKFEIVSGQSVTRSCRMIKSPAEIALMQLASDITMAAYRYVYAHLEATMLPSDISALMNESTRRLGGEPGFSMVLLNEASAYPHGTSQPQTLKPGGVVLMDCGCSVHDYESDISRTWVFGQPDKKQRKVWDTVKRGQEIVMATAQPGTPAGQVDDAVRAYYEKQGYGPGYRMPGLPHRTGHGIGMDGHEPVNFVHGEKTPLAPGMCFSNEPGIYIFGEFGVRLEDCLHMTAEGPRLFSALSPSIDRPFA